MSGSPPRIYWDANCFLSFINQDPRWLPTLEVLIDDARTRGAIRIVTSVLSIAEVAFAAAEKRKQALDAREEARIEHLWRSRGIALVEVNEKVARLARDIRREDILTGRTGRRRTPDIVHLATARFVAVQDMHTTEPDLHKYSNLWGFPVRDPFSTRFLLPGISDLP